MAVTATVAKPKVRAILIKAISGPIRAVAPITGGKITFEVSECTIDGKKDDGSGLTEAEAKQIKWVLKEATSQPSGKSFKLVMGTELASGTGKSMEYTVPGSMVGCAVVAMAYINSPSPKIAHWVKISEVAKEFTPSSSTHVALTTTYPEIDDVEKLDAAFKLQWKAFSKALEDAGAGVAVESTLRSRERAYMMHYCEKIWSGAIKPWEVPDAVHTLGQWTEHIGMEWTHTTADGRVDEAASKKAARQLMNYFEIAYPASLTSNHVQGKAIDVSITWTGTIKIKKKGGKNKEGKEVEGEEVEITTPPSHGGAKAEPAGNKQLREVAESYEIHKHLTDAPHWSVDGK